MPCGVRISVAVSVQDPTAVPSCYALACVHLKMLALHAMVPHNYDMLRYSNIMCGDIASYNMMYYCRLLHNAMQCNATQRNEAGWVKCVACVLKQTIGARSAGCKEAKANVPLPPTGSYRLEGTTLANRLVASRNCKYSKIPASMSKSRSLPLSSMSRLPS